MKENKPDDLRQKSPGDLRDMVVALRKEQFNIRFQIANGSTESIGRLAVLRKTIARLKTVMAEQRGRLAA